MKYLKVFVMVFVTSLMVNCDSSTTVQSLPSEITVLVFNKATDKPTVPTKTIEHTITITLSSTSYTGTAVFTDNDTTSTCSATLNLTPAQSSSLLTYLGSVRYSTPAEKTCPMIYALAYDKVTVTSGSGQLIIYKGTMCAQNVFSSGTETALYDLIKEIVQANSGYAACSSEWQYLF